MHARVMDMITAGFDHWIGVSWIGVSTTDLTWYAAEESVKTTCLSNERSEIPKLHQPLNQLRLNVEPEVNK